MGLFSRLLNFKTENIPLEDFFTEIVAALFSSEKKLLYSWLKYINVFEIEANLNVDVSTQQSFDALKHHGKSSRPDIVIELVGDGFQDLIFIESKIGSSEGEDQLQRYAEILAVMPNYRHKALIYITRDFEPKGESDVLKNVTQQSIKFKQLRWHQFYQFLSAQKETTLVQEICSFMREKNMGYNTQFSDTDIMALPNFPKVLKLMDVIIQGKVTQYFEEVTGQKQTRKNAALETLLTYGNYNIVADILREKWWCCLGFQLQRKHISDYPTAALWLVGHPKSTNKPEVVSMMKAVCSQRGWTGTELTSSLNSAPRIFRERSLQAFLSENDHIAAIEGFFIEALDEFQKIKEQYSHLPWRTGPESREDDSNG